MAQSARIDGKITDPGAVGQAITLNVAGFTQAGFQLTGTFTGTVHFKGTVDGVNFSDLGVVTIADSTTTVTTATNVGIWVAKIPFALSEVQIVCSAYTDGTIVGAIVAAG